MLVLTLTLSLPLGLILLVQRELDLAALNYAEYQSYGPLDATVSQIPKLRADFGEESYFAQNWNLFLRTPNNEIEAIAYLVVDAKNEEYGLFPARTISASHPVNDGEGWIDINFALARELGLAPGDEVEAHLEHDSYVPLTVRNIHDHRQEYGRNNVVQIDGVYLLSQFKKVDTDEPEIAEKITFFTSKKTKAEADAILSNDIYLARLQAAGYGDADAVSEDINSLKRFESKASWNSLTLVFITFIMGTLATVFFCFREVFNSTSKDLETIRPLIELGANRRKLELSVQVLAVIVSLMGASLGTGAAYLLYKLGLFGATAPITIWWIWPLAIAIVTLISFSAIFTAAFLARRTEQL